MENGGSKTGRSFKQLKLLSKKRPCTDALDKTITLNNCSIESLKDIEIDRDTKRHADCISETKEHREKEVASTIEHMFQKMTYDERFQQ